MRGRRFEVSTYGFDADLQLLSSDPYGGAASLGLAVPATLPTDPAQRYLFLLAQAEFGPNVKGRVVGLRQYLEIGTYVDNQGGCSYPLSLEVTSPRWRFIDGNVSWHLTRVDPTLYRNEHPNDAEGLQFADSTTPALIFQVPPADYHGPNGGRPYGTAVDPQLSCFYDLRYPWNNDDAQYLDDEFEGPCRIAFWASVLQTDPNARCTLALPGNVTTLMIPPEDAFVVNFPNSVYTRVAGSIIFETENMIELPRDLVEQRAKFDRCGRPDPRMPR
jgi:hypothetical protein